MLQCCDVTQVPIHPLYGNTHSVVYYHAVLSALTCDMLQMLLCPSGVKYSIVYQHLYFSLCFFVNPGPSLLGVYHLSDFQCCDMLQVLNSPHQSNIPSILSLGKVSGLQLVAYIGCLFDPQRSSSTSVLSPFRLSVLWPTPVLPYLLWVNTLILSFSAD